MLLVLVNTSGGREILEKLKESGVETVAMLPNVFDAARYGVDHVIAGSMKERRIRKAILEHKISAVIDALSDDEAEVTLAAGRVCKEKNVSLYKFLPFEPNYFGYDNVRIFENVHEVADALNAEGGKALLFGDALKIKRVAEWVLDKRKLYTMVPKGEEMNVDFSVNSCIPLANVLSSNSVDAPSDISHVVNLYGITAMVCYENLAIMNKVTLAEELETEIFVIKREMPENYIPVATVEDIVKQAENSEAEFAKKQAELDEEEKKRELDKNRREIEEIAEEEKAEKAEKVEKAKKAEMEKSAEDEISKTADEENSENADSIDTENENSVEGDAAVETVDECIPVNEETEDDSEDSEAQTGTEEFENAENSKDDGEYSVSRSKVVNPDGTINMRELVKCVREELNIED